MSRSSRRMSRLSWSKTRIRVCPSRSGTHHLDVPGFLTEHVQRFLRAYAVTGAPP